MINSKGRDGDGMATLTSEHLAALRRAFLRDWAQSPSNVDHWAERATSAQAIDSLENRVARDLSLIERILNDQMLDGSWKGVDYADKKRENWDAARHFTEFLHPLTIAYLTPTSPVLNDALIRDAIIRGIEYWTANDFTNPNWWWSVNGLPAYFLGPVALAVRDAMPPVTRRRVVELLERSDVRKRDVWRTGGNGLFDCRAAFILGLFDDDTRLVERVYEPNLSRCLSFGRPGLDGVQEDWSHLEHGQLVFNHGYGASLLLESAKLLWYLGESGIDPPEGQLDFLLGYLLDGCRWMAKGDFLDYAAYGRGIAVPRLETGVDKSVVGTYLSTSARYLLLAKASRTAELEALTNWRSVTAAHWLGNKMFYQADLMTHHAERFYASVRMFSRRSLNTEQCNGVNRLGHHLGEGQLAVVCAGNPYLDSFACWDWNKVPGTIVNCRSAELSGLDEIADTGWVPCHDPDADEGYVRERLRLGRLGRTLFVGGASNGAVGMASMDLKVCSLTAKKSWAFLGDEIVCFAAGITDSESGSVITTLDQRLRNGVVTIVRSNGVTEVVRDCPEGRRIDDVAMVHHDSVAYKFFEPQQVAISVGPQTGDWNRININLSDEPVTVEMFALWIEHGERPSNASRAYRIIPGVDVDHASSPECASPALLANDADLQATRCGELLLATFHQPGVIVSGCRGENLEIGDPCAVIYDALDHTVTVVDPTRELAQVYIAVGGERYQVPVSGGLSTVLNLSTRDVTGYIKRPAADVDVPTAAEPLVDFASSRAIAASSHFVVGDSNGDTTVGGESAASTHEAEAKWISVDLGGNRNILSIALDWVTSPAAYDVEVSGNGEEFTPLIRVREYGLPGRVEYPSLFVHARYVRILSRAGGQCHLRSLSVMGCEG